MYIDENRRKRALATQCDDEQMTGANMNTICQKNMRYVRDAEVDAGKCNPRETNHGPAALLRAMHLCPKSKGYIQQDGTTNPYIDGRIDKAQ